MWGGWFACTTVKVEVGDNLSGSALYADKFARHSTSDEKEIIIAKALVGESFDYGTERNRSLKMPPIKHAHGKH